MDKSQRRRLVECWIKLQHADEHSPEYEQNFWALRGLIGLVCDDPETAWAVVLQILSADDSEEIVGMLAAGPVEDLLAEHGDLTIDRVEELASSNAKFRELLRGVWKSSMSDAVWARVEAVREEP